MPGLPNSVAFLRIEGQRLQAIVGTWFGLLFWGMGAFSLFASSMGITDYTSRLAADVLKSTYLRDVGGVGEPAVLLAGLGPGRDRLRDPARGHGSTPGAARHLGVRRRHDDVPVFGAVDQPEPPASSGPDQDPFVPRGGADLVDGALRGPRGDDDPAADSAATRLCIE